MSWDARRVLLVGILGIGLTVAAVRPGIDALWWQRLLSGIAGAAFLYVLALSIAGYRRLRAREASGEGGTRG
ncbi:hypothetical protein [Streptomyces sp. ODS28]|uniref:hypothetical protein n=1 Tax=Streptomyces sp. ODS28 TaxID=3136688 RepID=UPI0031EFC393